MYIYKIHIFYQHIIIEYDKLYHIYIYIYINFLTKQFQNIYYYFLYHLLMFFISFNQLSTTNIFVSKYLPPDTSVKSNYCYICQY